jgi:ubiquinone biosynthesis UbiH/UbiF/VisC/COQ6 family hydroxylase
MKGEDAVEVDIAIVGAGLVGASLALALADSGLEIALIEGSPPPERAGGWDSRIYALSPATVSFLDELGIWKSLDAARLCPVRAMRIYGDDERSKLEFSAYQAGLAELAWIAESGAVQRALWRALERQPKLRLICPARPASLEHVDERIALAIDGGPAGFPLVSARLLVGADGAGSWARGASGIEAQTVSYRQNAVVANFDCERAHRSVAMQWFGADGVLAYLPLPGNRVSIVWSTGEEHADELLALSAAEFAARVAEAGRDALGRLELITPPSAFALARLSVDAAVMPRLALIGDAAHVVHPLAGQGVNLGFGDACALASTLRGRAPGADPGDFLLLRRYERQRAEDILAMRLVTDGLHHLYGATQPWVAWLRNAGLNLIDSAPVLKGLLARRAAG